MNFVTQKPNYLEVKSTLSLDMYEKPLKSIPNFVAIFQNDCNLKNLIRFNEISGSAENALTTQIWSETDDSQVQCYIEQMYLVRNKECYQNAFNIICEHNKYNPIKKILELHKWDGKNRIATLLQKYLKCDDTEYTKEIARLIFAGGIARLYEPGVKFDYMTIFKGKQGCGKSSFVNWLAINDSYFKEVNNIDGQEGKEAVEGAWICEVSELLALSKTKEVEAVKSFLTRRNDNYRKPYERRVTDNPRRCIFIGTTNKSQFLTDKTGNRRFLPIEVKSNGIELFKQQEQARADILQCWLEAKHNYDNKNYSLIASSAIQEDIERMQTDAVEDDWRVGMISEFLKSNNKVCVKMLWDKALNLEHKDCTKKDSNDIVSIMENMTDFERATTIRFDIYGTQRGWIRKPKEKVIEKATENNKPVQENIKEEPLEIDYENLPF